MCSVELPRRGGEPQPYREGSPVPLGGSRYRAAGHVRLKLPDREPRSRPADLAVSRGSSSLVGACDIASLIKRFTLR